MKTNTRPELFWRSVETQRLSVDWLRGGATVEGRKEERLETSGHGGGSLIKKRAIVCQCEITLSSGASQLSSPREQHCDAFMGYR